MSSISEGASERSDLLMTGLRTIVSLVIEGPIFIDKSSLSDSGLTTYTIRVKNSDLGKLIGRKGRTARAIRTIVYAHTERIGARATLQILGEELEETSNQDWPD